MTLQGQLTDTPTSQSFNREAPHGGRKKESAAKACGSLAASSLLAAIFNRKNLHKNTE